MNLTPRIKGILLQPKQEWNIIDTESTTIAELYKTYIVPLAAIGPVASLIGLSLIGISVPFVGSYRVPLTTSIAHAVVSYVLGLVGIYVLALIIDALAPSFAGEKNVIQALKVAAYSSTAAWLAGIFALIPMLSILGILGLYSLYLFYLGLPILMKVPPEKSLGYTVAVIVAAVVIFVIIGVASSRLITYPSLRLP